MIYELASYSWNKQLIDPDIKIIKFPDLKEARKELNYQWENLKCFHVQITSPHSTDKFKKSLHCMKSRPNKDRELSLSFEKIAVPAGLEIAIGNRKPDKLDVLRVRDFSGMPTASLHLTADKFFCDSPITGRHEIVLPRTSAETPALQLCNFQTCIATASMRPTEMDQLVGYSGDDAWFFLSQVEVEGGTAEISFSWMEMGKDYIQ